MRSVLTMAVALALAAMALMPPPIGADAIAGPPPPEPVVVLTTPEPGEYQDAQEMVRTIIRLQIGECVGEDLVDVVIAESARNYLDPALVGAVIQAESGCNPTASSDSSRGLMQLNDNTWPWAAEQLGIENPDPMDPTQNIRMGTWYLGWLMGEYHGDLHMVLTAYNRGIGGLAAWMREHGTAESPYSRKVLGLVGGGVDHAAAL